MTDDPVKRAEDAAKRAEKAEKKSRQLQGSMVAAGIAILVILGLLAVNGGI